MGIGRSAGQVVGLDAWRASLLLAGILLHGSIGLPMTPVFAGLDILSQTFRMGSFFGIAGALSAISIERYGATTWAARRLFRIGVPLGFGMTVIPPFIWAMAQVYGWPSPIRPLMFDWYHLWFLIGLLIYTLVLAQIFRARLDVVVADWLEAALDDGRLTASVIMLATALASAVLFAVVPPILSALLSPRMFIALRNTQLIAGYLPMFLLGVAGVRVPALGAALLAKWRLAVAIVCGIAAVNLAWFALAAPYMPEAEAEVITLKIRFVSGALCPPAMIALILRSALTVRQIPVAVLRLSEASYTMYLLHLPIAVAINLPLRRFGCGIYPAYAVAVVGSASLSYLFHRACVRRSDVLRLLLNGRPFRRLRQSDYVLPRP